MKILLRLLLFFAAAQWEYGAISRTGAGALVLTSSSASTSAAYDSGSAGSGRVLFVGTVNGGASEQVLTVSYGGTSLTKITAASRSNGTVALWWLSSGVPSGSNTLAVTASGGTTYSIMAVAYTGASGSTDGTATDNTTNAASGAQGTYTESVTTSVANDWIVTIAFGGSATWNNSAAGGFTGDSTTLALNGAVNGQLYDKGPVAGTGPNSITATTSSSGGAALVSITVAFSPAAGSTPIRHRVISGGLQ